jgi:hypothetical protein
MEAERAAWVKPTMVLTSPLSPRLQFAAAQVDREESAERRWGSEPVSLSLFSSVPLFAAAKAVQVKNSHFVCPLFVVATLLNDPLLPI